MTRTIWLASYPKSGNTWFRMLIANLSATDKPVDINDLPERSGIASSRGPFDYLTLIESGLLTFDEVDAIRPRVHQEIMSGAPDGLYEAPEQSQPIWFVKCHDAYTYTADGEPLLGGAKGAEGAVVIVRDPRDVAPSLANHNQTTLDATIDFMESPSAAICAKSDRQMNQLRQRLLGWSRHVESWLRQRDIPIHLVRYEDLKADTAGTLRRALAFAERDASDADIARAVAFADFSELKRQATEIGFGEAPPAIAKAFFRRGQAGAWRDELTAEQVARIEAAHAPMMQRLGYPLSTEQTALARAG